MGIFVLYFILTFTDGSRSVVVSSNQYMDPETCLYTGELVAPRLFEAYDSRETPVQELAYHCAVGAVL